MTYILIYWLERSVTISLIRSYQNKVPSFAPTARAAENASIIGSVSLADQSSVWYGAVLRGDESAITVGEGSNIQDNAVIHCDAPYPAVIGRDVTVGHGAIIHGCTIEDRCLIGMGAILLNGCVIGEGSLVAAGALVTQGMIVPPGSMVMGSPAKVTRPLRPEESADILDSAATYRHLSGQQLPLATEI